MFFQIADEMKSRGGEPHPVQVDHSQDKEVEELFAKIGREQNGKLDVLVAIFNLFKGKLKKKSFSPFLLLLSSIITVIIQSDICSYRSSVDSDLGLS